MSRLKRLAGSAIALVALSVVVVTFSRNLQALPALTFSWVSGLSVVVGVGVGCVVTVVAAEAWRTLLGGAGVQLSRRRAFAICGTAQIAKYLPGNVFHLAGRAALATKEGVPLPVSIASMTLETLIVIATGAAFAAPLVIEHRNLLLPLFTAKTAWIWTAVVVVVAAVFCFVWLRFRAQAKETIGAALRIARVRTVAVVVVCDVLTFVLLGGSLFLVADATWPALALSPTQCIFGFALAWVVGFVTPGAPGGVGVREAVFLIVLGASSGVAVAASLAIVSRLLSILGDVLTFAIARAVDRSSPQPGLVATIR
ncbi:MAG: lysylphosphatidylglycerol synthase domain-containing protein [Deltaproteobacteria bacterium]|nr:lysylphosphatidylglycerol synthase domain-containing protein [Deltaproteobacteria bacterium]